jgi:hypothetical protein
MAENAPDWMLQASAVPLPDYDKKAAHVVMHDELRIAADAKGRITKTRTTVLKILRDEARGNARADVIYKTDTDKVEKFQAWLIRADGEVKKYDKDDIIDTALVSNDVYNDVRMKVISASDQAEEGAVFGYQVVLEEKSVFSQYEWFFQEHEPELSSRLVVELPNDWSVQAVTFNHPEIKPVVNGNTYIWELKNLPNINPEPFSPSVMNLVPRLAVSILPPAGVTTPLRFFRNWADVSLWLTELNDPQVVLNDAMIRKAKELISGAETDLEKIGAIARFAQDINYISIQTGIGRGGGYRPHSAMEVFEKNYGDCKDKTNLMRALLKAVGMTSYPVSIYSGNPYFVREEWPSPQQFNHSIIAVKVSASTDDPAIIEHETLGRLLLFDPTDNYTNPGEIPRQEQGSLALLIAGKDGKLFRVPESSPEANRTERKIGLELLANGSIRSRIEEVMYGESASIARAEFRELTQDSYRKMIEAWISNSARRSEISRIDFIPDISEGRSGLNVDFTAERYGQLLQDRLLVFNPNIVSRRNEIFLTEPSRELPVMVESRAFNEDVQVKLPDGFIVDELPEAVELKKSFGYYRAECRVEKMNLIYNRSLVMNRAVIPAGQYEEIRQFLIAIRNAEQSPVVLVKQ